MSSPDTEHEHGVCSSLELWGKRSRGNNKWLARFVMSYITYLSSLLSIRSNMDYVAMPRYYRETDCHWLLLVGLRQCVDYTIFSTFKPSQCDANEIILFHQKHRNVEQTHYTFGCFFPHWTQSGPHHQGPLRGYCEVKYKWKDLSIWSSRTNTLRCVHWQNFLQRLSCLGL